MPNIKKKFGKTKHEVINSIIESNEEVGRSIILGSDGVHIFMCMSFLDGDPFVDFEVKKGSSVQAFDSIKEAFDCFESL